MAQLGYVPLKRLILPSSTPEEEVWADLKTEFTVGEQAALSNLTGEAEDIVFGRVAIFISNWSFTTHDGQIAEVTVDNVKKLLEPDFFAITDELQTTIDKSAEALTIEEKKASVSSSVPVKTDTPSPSPDSPTII